MTTETVQNDIPATQRRIYGQLNPDGNIVHMATLTHASRTDTVKIIIDEVKVLPVVFVPGTMGSNLKVIGSNETVWRYNTKVQIGFAQAFKTPGQRQRLMHPDRTELDPGGAVPSRQVGALRTKKDFHLRGWGEISADSYQDWLVWLEENLNGRPGARAEESAYFQLISRLRNTTAENAWNPQKPFQKLTADECASATQWKYPVYACGYNWLQSNELSAARLANRIDQIISDNNRGQGVCAQVIVLTHSMGGLTARRCAQLPGMDKKIAGILHGVMPAIGASVAYRRCKIGMWDESHAESMVIGRTGLHVTAVFAQSPGALELLPTEEYSINWMDLRDPTQQRLPETPSTFKPYTGFYRERERWWGVINEDWLTPEDGIALTWDTYLIALTDAGELHKKIKQSYHPNTLAFYGAGVPSFHRIMWSYELHTRHDIQSPKIYNNAELMDLPRAAGYLNGDSHDQLYGPMVKRRQQGIREIDVPSVTYRLRINSADDFGDGTVPILSGRAPLEHVKQIFCLNNVQHQPAYDSIAARELAVYAIAKIGALALSIGKAPAPAQVK